MPGEQSESSMREICSSSVVSMFTSIPWPLRIVLLVDCTCSISMHSLVLMYDIFRYNILGLAAVRVGDSFFDNVDGRATALATALLENIDSMELHHIRQLLHLVVIPTVKVCPVNLWDPWLGQLLPPVLIHCHRVLSTAWTSLLQEGFVKAPGTWAAANTLDMGDGSSIQQIKTEVMKEKLLRDLTRETCNLLSTTASPALNRSSQPDQSQGNGVGIDAVSFHFNAAASLIGYAVQSPKFSSVFIADVLSLHWISFSCS